MSFIEAIKSGFRNYVKFSGRARRSEFWYWTLFTFLLGILTSILDSVLFGETTTSTTSSGASFNASTSFTPISGLVSIALLLPSAAMAFRRLHDTGRSGWWYIGQFLLAIVFGVGVGVAAVSTVSSGGSGGGALAFSGILGLAMLIYAIVLLVFYIKDSEPGDNKYGPNPKGVGGMNPAMAAGAYGGHSPAAGTGYGQQDPQQNWGQPQHGQSAPDPYGQQSQDPYAQQQYGQQSPTPHPQQHGQYGQPQDQQGWGQQEQSQPSSDPYRQPNQGGHYGNPNYGNPDYGQQNPNNPYGQDPHAPRQ